MKYVYRLQLIHIEPSHRKRLIIFGCFFLSFFISFFFCLLEMFHTIFYFIMYLIKILPKEAVSLFSDFLFYSPVFYCNI